MVKNLVPGLLAFDVVIHLVQWGVKQKLASVDGVVVSIFEVRAGLSPALQALVFDVIKDQRCVVHHLSDRAHEHDVLTLVHLASL